MDNFDEARDATVNMFEPEQEEEQLSLDDTPVPEEQEQSEVADTLNDAVQTAEVAAQAVGQKEDELQSLRQELDALKVQNETLQKTLQQMNDTQKETVIEQALEPPMLDVNALAFKDEDEILKAQTEYANQMAEYSKKQILKELSPFIEQAKAITKEKEKNEVIGELSKYDEMKGIQEMMPQIENIISKNPELFQNVPVEQAIVAAYTMAKGVNAIHEPVKEGPTREQLMELYDNDPEFRQELEKKRIEELKDSQQVPSFTASSGAVNAALNIPKAPETFDEASERTRKMFKE